MKKIAIVLAAFVFVIGCSKKVSSGASSSSSNTSSNTSGVAASSSSNAPAAEAKTAPASVAVNSNTDPTSQSAKAVKEPGQLSPEQLGQATYSAKCGKCHGLKVTTDYTVDRWITVMQVMAIKAHLSDVEKENVLAYVKANAKKG